MKAAVARARREGGGGLELKVESVPRPVPDHAKDEALVKVTRAGVCNTDLEIMRGYMGFEGILGHEFVGVVEDAPPGRREEFLGKRVCADINVTCDDGGVCGVCCIKEEGHELVARRRRNHCPRRTVMGILGRSGCFAEYIVLPCRNLHVVDDNVSNEEACFSEPLAAALRIVEQQLASCADERVAVLGDGKLGLLIAAALVTSLRQQKRGMSGAGTKVFVFGRHRKKLQMLQTLSTGGGGVEVELVDTSTPEGQSTLTDAAASMDCVVEATGSPNGFDQACGLLHPLGTLVLKSTCAAGVEKGLNLAMIVIDELRVVGSRCGPTDLALKVLADQGPLGFKHTFPLGELVEAVYKLDDIQEAFEKAGERGSLKVVVEM